jgi:hypothetical protein
MKVGWISGEAGTPYPYLLLKWDVNGMTQGSASWNAGVWHNIAYAIVSIIQYVSDPETSLTNERTSRRIRRLLPLHLL